MIVTGAFLIVGTAAIFLCEGLYRFVEWMIRGDE
jgi:hypothetical protein